MLRDKNKNRLFRRVDVRITFPDNIFPVKHLVQRAGPKQGFGPKGIDDILEHLVEHLDTMYPWWDFKMTPLVSSGRTAYFSCTFVGYREGYQAPPPLLPDPEPEVKNV